jgi:predicted RNA-binding protein Jag
LISWVHQAGRPATTPPRKLNERRVLHDLFKQNPGPESRSKDHEGDRKVVALQKRG